MATGAVRGGLLLVLVFAILEFRVAFGETAPLDAVALRSLMDYWHNTPPPSWGKSDDPCGTPWDGVLCDGSRVVTLKLSTMGLKGTLSGDIGQLDELHTLDLSYNKDLGGSLPASIEKLKKLRTLILFGCSFTGAIPSQLGSLPDLTYIALNSNNFTGRIPNSLGYLSKLYWLDLADNELTGSLPISSGSESGLDKLVNARHFHFNKNQLSGNIPSQIFHSDMKLIHVLFDANKFTGRIPDTIGLVQSLEVLRLDRNLLIGPVPSSISNLTSTTELNLASNRLTGLISDLSGMDKLGYVDLSNNSFDVAIVPKWFNALPSLTTLVITSGGLTGELPGGFLSIPQLQKVTLNHNSLNGTLNLTGSLSPQLQLVDLEDNIISSILTGSGSEDITVRLLGNPYCVKQVQDRYCLLQQKTQPPYSTSLDKCSKMCPQEQSISPSTCDCAVPYMGLMIFRGPSFSDLTNSSKFQSLERHIWTELGLNPGSVYIKDLIFNNDDYMQFLLQLFPSGSLYFSRAEIQRLGFYLSNQTYKPPSILGFGPYIFYAFPYPFPDSPVKKAYLSNAVVGGIVAACAILVIAFIFACIYAIRQKRNAEKAAEISNPFASWGGPGGNDSGTAPQLKGAKCFSFDSMKKCTQNFSKQNEIGSGGYGKVYRGTISSGQVVAIKRAQTGSMQGGLEFKTEIELLSRVHHKNLVGLVGFCFDQEEQMLVYEYIANGSLRDTLTGKNGITLDWKKRLRIALGSARGLAYLHELADPPIIHRDVKSSNILLDDNLNAKVADFGLSKLLSDSEKGHVSTQVKGTMGYLDPEYYLSQQLTAKSDVYSFGVVMLELITAKQPIEKGKYVVREVRLAMDQNDKEHYGLVNLMDPVIQKTQNFGFLRFVDLAMQCVGESVDNRPTMNEIVKEIESILQHDGSNLASASSSATEFGMKQGTLYRPYNESLPEGQEDMNGDSSDCNFGYTFPMHVEPK